mgnify:CR=1 FL=1
MLNITTTVSYSRSGSVKGNFDDMIFESAIDFWFDDVDFGEDKLWKYFNELK